MGRVEIKHILWSGDPSPHDVEGFAAFQSSVPTPARVGFGIDPLAGPRLAGALEDGAIMAVAAKQKPVDLLNRQFEHAEIGQAIGVDAAPARRAVRPGRGPRKGRAPRLPLPRGRMTAASVCRRQRPLRRICSIALRSNRPKPPPGLAPISCHLRARVSVGDFKRRKLAAPDHRHACLRGAVEADGGDPGKAHRVVPVGARAGQVPSNAGRHLAQFGRDFNHGLGLSKMRAWRDTTLS